MTWLLPSMKYRLLLEKTHRDNATTTQDPTRIMSVKGDPNLSPSSMTNKRKRKVAKSPSLRSRRHPTAQNNKSANNISAHPKDNMAEQLTWLRCRQSALIPQKKCSNNPP